MHSNRQTILPTLILLACAAAVVALTTLPASARLIRFATRIIIVEGHSNLNDAIGHAALYALLTAVTYWALRTRLPYRWALPLALGGALIVGGATEFIQQFSPGRSMMLSDLLANWLGATTVALLAAFRRSLRG